MFHSRNTRGSRLKIAHRSVSKTTCHPRVMSHMLPHLPQNTSSRSLSPTSPVFRTSSPSLTCPLSAHSGLECEHLRDPRRSGGYTNSASPTGYEPKLTQSDDFEHQGIELDRNPGTDLQPRRIELDRNIGTDPYQMPERILGDDEKILAQNMRRRLENLTSRCPASNQGYTRTTIQLKALQTRILKMENYEKCWPHRCMHMGEEKIMVLLKDP